MLQTLMNAKVVRRDANSCVTTTMAATPVIAMRDIPLMVMDIVAQVIWIVRH